METYALDFETFYDKHCSIKSLGPLGYFAHPQFDAYMVSIVGDNGYEFVGHPRDLDWSILEGSIVLSHNASFDETLYLYGVDQNWWPEIKPHAWYCTADMAVACGLPRSLKNATAQAFDIEVSKETRNTMSGKRWETMSEEFRREVEEYALKDSVLCLRLWKEYESKWPQFERDISRMNRNIVQRGLPIDVDLMEKNLQTVRQKLFETEKAIPWADEKPLLSRKAFDHECMRIGIEPPVSLAQTNQEAQEWIRRHGHKYKWIEAVSNYRRVNSLIKKIESFDAATMPDSRYYGGIMYFGGHTGRFSGSGGNLNLQNMPRDPMFGANIRHMIAAPEGRTLVASDLSNIEVRTLCWLAEDKKTLHEIKKTEDIYEAFAIRFGVWSKDRGALKKEDVKLRHKVKALVLGCGYGAGANRFAQMYDMPLEEAEKAVDTYRARLPEIPKFWRDLSSGLKAAHGISSPYILDLPSGRSLNYGMLKPSKDDMGRTQYSALMNRNGQRTSMKLWGGVLAENLSQAMARDVLCYMMLEIEKAGLEIILHVHDEVVVECDEDKAEEVLDTINKIMSTPPEWCSDLPLASEGYISKHYKK